MKTNFDQRLCIRQPEGVALFLVLAFLALIITLVLAFFSTVTTELGAARSAASQVTAKQLADTSVQVVSSVIRKATSSSSSVAWASQPGMIRTYGKSSSDALSKLSSPLSYFKLYSSDDMEATYKEINDDKYDPTDDLDGQWDLKPAQFTDLNSPVSDNAGKIHFPIIDPRTQSAPGTSVVDGFSYGDTAVRPTGSGKTDVKINLVNAGGSGSDLQRVPMPVKWIYVLKDGTLTAPRGVDVATGKIANWTGASIDKSPSATNPIVGRIAFWTDDDTSKININTAAGDLKTLPDSSGGPGSFWDIPRAETPMDRALAISQVTTNEFQRYPGHPATVSLSAVFPDLVRSKIATLAPRAVFVLGKGSQGGSRSNYKDPDNNVLPRKTDRLYGSVDELLFKPTITSVQRDQNIPTTPPIISPDILEQRKFFLTASNRAPDLNLFGQPRVSMWPVHAVNSSTYRTASDQLLAFCTTVGPPGGGKRYHFTRSASTSSTTDYASNARNQKIYAYLRNLMDKPIPGFGGPTNGFGTKYGAINCDQILTEIFDYIRITNLQDKNLLKTSRFTLDIFGAGTGQVVPISIPALSDPETDPTKKIKTKGFGRMETISEAALQFYATATNSSGNATKMRAVLLLEGFRPAAGFSGIRSKLSYTISGLDLLSVEIANSTGTNTVFPLKFPSLATNNITFGGFYSYSATSLGGISNAFYDSSGNRKAVFGTNPDTNYPFISQTDIDLTAVSGTTMKLNEATIHLTINYGAEVVQKVALKFPVIAQLPLPKEPKVLSGFNLKDYNERIRGFLFGTAWDSIIDPSDVVRSLEPSGSPVNGDLRLVVANAGEVDNVFAPHALYDDPIIKLAHSIRTSDNRLYPSANYPLTHNGKLIKDMIYDKYSDFPTKITTGAVMSSGLSGDWDNGIANQVDGPLINKADEGTAVYDSADPPYWYLSAPGVSAGSFFSPNRQVASPVMLGSLSTGVLPKIPSDATSLPQPWQTLLFRPDVAGTHPGSAAPKDYLLLDLFIMPIVEPYAISEPLSTAGKVNMNYQIAPFNYIKRETAVRAALQSIFTMAIPTGDGKTYKKDNTANYRKQVDATETLKQFQARFDIADSTKPSLFVSSAEVCDLHLVPKGTPLTNMPLYWDSFKLTGDNTREMPYNHLYPLLTTKSNTYTVHMRVQVLKKSRSTDATIWDESKDLVLSEHRGSSVIERYIDPEDSRFQTTDPNYVDPDTKSLEDLYKIRVLSTKKF